MCHFLWVHQKGGEIFLPLVCFTPLLPSVIQVPSSFVFHSRVDLGAIFTLWDALLDSAGAERRSGSQASTRCGGNVHLQINQNFLLQKC